MGRKQKAQGGGSNSREKSWRKENNVQLNVVKGLVEKGRNCFILFISNEHVFQGLSSSESRNRSHNNIRN